MDALKSSQERTCGTGSDICRRCSETSPLRSFARQGGVETIKAPIEAEGGVTVLNKKVGDTVEEDDVIAEIETDKATIEINATCDGVREQFPDLQYM